MFRHIRKERTRLEFVDDGLVLKTGFQSHVSLKKRRTIKAEIPIAN